MRLLVCARRHGAGRLAPLQAAGAGADLALSGGAWQRTDGAAVRARQAALLRALLLEPWAEGELRRLLALPVTGCAYRPEWLPPPPPPSAAPDGAAPPPAAAALSIRARAQSAAAAAAGGAPSFPPADVSVPRADLGIAQLRAALCDAVGVPVAACAGVLHPPDILVTDDDDVAALPNGTELVVLVGGDAEKAQAEREVKAIEAELAAAAARLDRLRGEAQ